jgi:hypothetical protein
MQPASPANSAGTRRGAAKPVATIVGGGALDPRFARRMLLRFDHRCRHAGIARIINTSCEHGRYLGGTNWQVCCFRISSSFRPRRV